MPYFHEYSSNLPACSHLTNTSAIRAKILNLKLLSPFVSDTSMLVINNLRFKLKLARIQLLASGNFLSSYLHLKLVCDSCKPGTLARRCLVRLRTRRHHQGGQHHPPTPLTLTAKPLNRFYNQLLGFPVPTGSLFLILWTFSLSWGLNIILHYLLLNITLQLPSEMYSLLKSTHYYVSSAVS